MPLPARLLPALASAALLAAPRAAAAPLDFSAYVVYGAGPETVAVAAGDVTGDGEPDALALSGPDPYLSGDQTLYVHEECGYRVLCLDGAYPVPDADPRGLAVGDFDGDGRLDAAVGGQSGLHVFWGEASGALSGPTTYAASVPLYAVVAHDLDGDGRTDVAAVGSASPVHVWMQGAAGLGAATPVSVSVGGASGLAAGDLDGDGDGDLAVLNASLPTGRDVQIVQRVPGGFLSGAGYDVGTGIDCRGIAVGDTNGDGRDDVIVTYGNNTPGAYVGVFRQNAAGSLDAAVTTAAYNSPSAVAAADLDGDGDDDVALLHNGWQAASTHQQAASLLGAYQLEPIPYAASYPPEALAAADVDGDGIPEILLADPALGLLVLWNQSVEDADSDGWTYGDGDCDDGDPATWPGAPEVCDHEDNDCDGDLDPAEVDGDGDGFDECQGDCDDADPSFHPGAPEGCDAHDQDCDGGPDPAEIDDDGDGYAECEGDCDDADAAATPFDGDGDGQPVCAGDCDDTEPGVYLGAAEVCDGRDNDCDGVSDEATDADLDGYDLCEGDCADLDPGAHPGAPEVCGNGRDDDCDGFADLTLAWFTAGVAVAGDEGAPLSLQGEAVIDDCGGAVDWRLTWFSSHPGVLGAATCEGWDGVAPTCVPPDDMEGVATLRFETRAGELAEHTVAVTVANVAPRIENSPTPSARVGEVWTFAASVSDPGADALDFALEGDVPPGLWVRPDGSLDWTPGGDAVGTWALALVVRDDDGGEDRLDFALTVTGDPASGDDDGAPDDDSEPGDDDSAPDDDSAAAGDDDGPGGCASCQSDHAPAPPRGPVAALLAATAVSAGLRRRFCKGRAPPR